MAGAESHDRCQQRHSPEAEYVDVPRGIGWFVSKSLQRKCRLYIVVMLSPTWLHHEPLGAQIFTESFSQSIPRSFKWIHKVGLGTVIDWTVPAYQGSFCGAEWTTTMVSSIPNPN